MSLRSKIESVLFRELNERRTMFEEAKKEFIEVTADIPSGLPSPDGALRIRNIGKAYHSSLEGYAIALREYNAFVLEGTVPVRLRTDPTPGLSDRSRRGNTTCSTCQTLAGIWSDAERVLFAVELVIAGPGPFNERDLEKSRIALEDARVEFETARRKFEKHRRSHAGARLH